MRNPGSIESESSSLLSEANSGSKASLIKDLDGFKEECCAQLLSPDQKQRLSGSHRPNLLRNVRALIDLRAYSREFSMIATNKVEDRARKKEEDDKLKLFIAVSREINLLLKKVEASTVENIDFSTKQTVENTVVALKKMLDGVYGTGLNKGEVSYVQALFAPIQGYETDQDLLDRVERARKNINDYDSFVRKAKYGDSPRTPEWRQMRCMVGFALLAVVALVGIGTLAAELSAPGAGSAIGALTHFARAIQVASLQTASWAGYSQQNIGLQMARWSLIGLGAVSVVGAAYAGDAKLSAWVSPNRTGELVALVNQQIDAKALEFSKQFGQSAPTSS